MNIAQDALSLVAEVKPTITPFDRLLQDNDEFRDDDDIYRGGLPSSTRPSSPDSTSSTTSSSSSERPGGRLGALAAIVDLAISRWARGIRRNSSASTSSSSSSSSSSSTTVTRAKRRPPRRSSQTSLLTVQSERDIAARITRLKALEESRRISREFALYVPPTNENLDLGAMPEGKEEPWNKRIICTTLLPTVLNHLEILIKKTRPRRPRGRSREPQGMHERTNTSTPSTPFQALYPSPDNLSVQQRHVPTAPKKSKKGKHRELPSSLTTSRNTILQHASHLMPKAWFLDVASPTWEDLRAIGKLLHLHPLTLEDILQQDPREKLEVFPKLGYYFISFRAIESQAEREKIQRETRKHVDSLEHGIGKDEGPIGEANVYLAVFNEGICCFHYRDISEHIDRVRNRIVLLGEVVNMSSDWIAHGILDSIVDSFFPLLREIEKEVMAIDNLIYTGLDSGQEVIPDDSPTNSDVNPINEKSSPTYSDKDIFESNEKYPFTYSITSRDSIRPRFASPRPTLKIILRRGRRYTGYLWESLWSKRRSPHTSPTFTTLRRMTKTRRLVTSLGRLLATKSEVVAQIRKRLTQAGQPSLRNGEKKVEEREVAIYMGDVQDHLLTLQHSLIHIERMLSQSHPSYLSQLRSIVARTKSGTDRALMYLTIITMGVLCCQTLIGIFSINVTLPMNNHAPGHPFNVFGIVVFLLCSVVVTYLCVVRHWWKSAKRGVVL